MDVDELVANGQAALDDGRWQDARGQFETALADGETAQACFGLAVALWWLGENDAGVERCSRAYVLFRAEDDDARAIRCAIWLAITYKANFGNDAAANGWLGRAERLLERFEEGSLHGWVWVARGYRLPDLQEARELTERAVEVAQAVHDLDLEIVALAQLGFIRVGEGDAAAGFALLDEAMAAALAGEAPSFDTVVYTCCDMLNACELMSDVERAAEWCAVADDFVERYGCPFLYAECRTYYGSVLAATGRWVEAEQELMSALRTTEASSPGLHARALTRLANLRIRQGRLEEADQLLSALGARVDVEAELALAGSALLLARGDAVAASHHLEQRMDALGRHQAHLASALELLVEAYLGSGDLRRAGEAAERLAAASPDDERGNAVMAAARGRLALARGDASTATLQLGAALRSWTRLDHPYETARVREDLARALVGDRRDVALDHAREAMRTYESLGATQGADRVAAFLRGLGASGRSAPKGLDTLTNREREVLRLLGYGLTNPEIAERLHVSPKTASHHVSNILGKLDVRNRTEAASYAVAEPGALAPVRRVER